LIETDELFEFSSSNPSFLDSAGQFIHEYVSILLQN